MTRLFTHLLECMHFDQQHMSMKTASVALHQYDREGVENLHCRFDSMSYSRQYSSRCLLHQQATPMLGMLGMLIHTVTAQ